MTDVEKYTFILDIIKIIVPILTSFAVCGITLYSANKRNKEAMMRQQINYEENVKLSEKKYQDQFAINEENERLKHLPYLSLIPKDKNHRFSGKMTEATHNIFSIPFTIKNEGEGIAFSIHLKYLRDKEKPKNRFKNSVSFKNNGLEDGEYNILGVSEPIDTDILRVNNEAEFCLCLSAVNKKHLNICPYSDIRWEFEIEFSDILGREYLQSYSFCTSTRNNEIRLINSYMPQLKIKEVTKN